MGWVHAVLTILAVVGGSHFAADLPYYYHDEGVADLAQFHQLRFIIVGIIMLTPPPVMVGIVLWRGRAFGEPPDPDRRVSLPAMATAAILVLWWLMLAGSVGMSIAYQLAG